MKKYAFTLENVLHFVRRLVKNDFIPTNENKSRKPGRSCRIEELERREMLSANMLDFDPFPYVETSNVAEYKIDNVIDIETIPEQQASAAPSANGDVIDQTVKSDIAANAPPTANATNLKVDTVIKPTLSTINLTWTASTDTNVTGYVISYSWVVNGITYTDGEWIQGRDTVKTEIPYLLSGAEYAGKGVTYTFTIRATTTAATNYADVVADTVNMSSHSPALTAKTADYPAPKITKPAKTDWSGKANVGATYIQGLTWDRIPGTTDYKVTLNYTFKYVKEEPKMVRIDGDWEEHDVLMVKVTHTVTVTETYHVYCDDSHDDGETRSALDVQVEVFDSWKNGIDHKEEVSGDVYCEALQFELSANGKKVKADFFGLFPSTKYNITVVAVVAGAEGWALDEESEGWCGFSAAAKTSISTTAYSAPKITKPAKTDWTGKANVGATYINNLTWDNIAGTACSGNEDNYSNLGYIVTLSYTYQYVEYDAPKMVKVDGEWEEHDEKTVNEKHTVNVTESYYLDLGYEGDVFAESMGGKIVDSWKNGYAEKNEDSWEGNDDALRFELSADGRKVKANFLGLDPGTKYNITVTAVMGSEFRQFELGADEDGDLSGAVYSTVAKTSIATASYAAVKGLKVTQNPQSKSDSIVVSWNDSPAAETSGYIISVFLPLKTWKEDGEWCFENGEGEGAFYAFEFDEDGNLESEDELEIINLNAGTNKPPQWQVIINELNADTTYQVRVYAFVENEDELFRERFSGEAGEGTSSKFDIHSVFEEYICSKPAAGKIKTAREVLYAPAPSPLAGSAVPTAGQPSWTVFSTNTGPNGIVYYDKDDKEYDDATEVTTVADFDENGEEIEDMPGVGLPKSANFAFEVLDKLEDADDLLIANVAGKALV